MKKQLLAVAIAASLAVPQVGFAAEDDSGMQYVSASEGLFGSLRTRYVTNEDKRNHARIEADGSVFGYRGSLDIGNGLTGTYHYEQRIQAQDGENLSESGAVRYNYVGLRGAFGSMEAGSMGSFVAGVPNVTDVTANGGGNFVPFYRRARAIQYTSPELNGFQAGGHIQMKGGEDKDGNPQVNQWALAAKYAVRGFTVGGAYIVDPEGYNTFVDNGAGGGTAGDGTKHADEAAVLEDATTWFVSGKYAQDNWAVAVMHGQKNTSDNGRVAVVSPFKSPDAPSSGGDTTLDAHELATTILPAYTRVASGDDEDKGRAYANDATEDATYTSVSGNISVGKVGLAVLHDIGSDLKGVPGNDRTVTALSAIYNFTSRSRVWVAYIAHDRKDTNQEQDQVSIGMRMDF